MTDTDLHQAAQRLQVFRGALMGASLELCRQIHGPSGSALPERFPMAIEIAVSACVAAKLPEGNLARLAQRAWPIQSRRRFVHDLVEHARTGVLGPGSQLPELLRGVFWSADHAFATLTDEVLRDALALDDSRGAARALVLSAHAFGTTAGPEDKGERQKEATRIRTALEHTAPLSWRSMRTWLDAVDRFRPVVDHVCGNADATRKREGVIVAAAAMLGAIAGDEKFIDQLWDVALPESERALIAAERVHLAATRPELLSVAELRNELISIYPEAHLLSLPDLKEALAKIDPPRHGRGHLGAKRVTADLLARAKALRLRSRGATAARTVSNRQRRTRPRR
jgi:hypothetical protein